MRIKLLMALVSFFTASVASVVFVDETARCEPEPCATGSGAGDGSARLVDPASLSVALSGRTTRPISPGVSAPVNMRLHNPNDFPITAGRLTVALGRVTAPRSTRRRSCTRSDFSVEKAPGRLRVALAPNETTTLRIEKINRPAWPRVRMHDRATNQDGCKGATLTLRYRARGTRAGG